MFGCWRWCLASTIVRLMGLKGPYHVLHLFYAHGRHLRKETRHFLLLNKIDWLSQLHALCNVANIAVLHAGSYNLQFFGVYSCWFASKITFWWGEIWVGLSVMLAGRSRKGQVLIPILWLRLKGPYFPSQSRDLSLILHKFPAIFRHYFPYICSVVWDLFSSDWQRHTLALL